MHITIKRDELVRPLTLVAGVVERRQTLPILSYIKMRQAKGRLVLTGTDLEIEVSVEMPVSQGDAEITVPARKLLDICRALPEGSEIKLTKQGEKASLIAGKSRFTLVTLPPADFPSLEAANWEPALTIDQIDIKRLLQRTQFCMAQQDVRYYLNGLYLELGNKTIRAVATDGHRMALSELKVSTAVSERQIIVPRKGIHEISRLLDAAEGEVDIQTAANHIRLQTSGVVFTSKLIDGRFPDYTKVVPATQSKTIGVDRAAFREALSRVAILSNEKYRGVRVSVVDGKLSVSAHNPEQEEAVEELDVDYRGEAIEIGFNVNYLIEAVSAIESTHVNLGLNDANSSCVLSGPSETSTRYIIMPMRL